MTIRPHLSVGFVVFGWIILTAFWVLRFRYGGGYLRRPALQQSVPRPFFSFYHGRELVVIPCCCQEMGKLGRSDFSFGGCSASWRERGDLAGGYSRCPFSYTSFRTC